MDRYTTRTLASGATAVLDSEARNQVVFIGPVEEAQDYLGDYDAYLADVAAEAAAEDAYNRMLEARAERGSWFGGGEDRF